MYQQFTVALGGKQNFFGKSLGLAQKLTGLWLCKSKCKRSAGGRGEEMGSQTALSVHMEGGLHFPHVDSVTWQC